MTASEEYDRMEWHLHNWADWMRGNGLSRLSIPSRVCTIGISHTADFDQLAEAADSQAAKAMDGCIASLAKAERKAVYCEYLGEDWPYRQALGLVLVLAKEEMRRIMDRRGMV